MDEFEMFECLEFHLNIQFFNMFAIENDDSPKRNIAKKMNYE